MKYLQLVCDPPLPEGQHITFAYFGSKRNPSVEYVENQLKSTKAWYSQFLLVPAGFDKFDKDGGKVDVLKFDCVRIFKLLRAVFVQGAEKDYPGVSADNRLPDGEYNPHITFSGPAPDVQKYLVTGIESNDGSWKMMFTY